METINITAVGLACVYETYLMWHLSRFLKNDTTPGGRRRKLPARLAPHSPPAWA